ncbi:beta-mannosidase [Gordonia hankookensis]|uniref:Beta-mannosidase n=1 Tax=Gordonia hankookensis TaxID=589403 RepID=A0ABR7W8H4_9ACTN|nr:beta-mannosidase [Gordonia hankookensis]MBD1319117.1 beta-mannosidase [Gordonia hankookensis]
MHRLRTVASLCVILVAASVVATGCSPSTPEPSGESPAHHVLSGRVSTTPTGLLLDGHDWWPSGFNAYQLGTDWSVNKGCGAEVDLDDYFGALPPHALTRISFFSMFVVDKTTGSVDFGPLDAVLAAAERHDQLILPVLTGSTGICEDDQFKDRSWYIDGWLTRKSLGGMTFADWITAAVTRWKDERAVAGWELVGEPETSVCGTSGCDWQARRCPDGGAAVLKSFFDDAGERLRSIDPGRPIFAGLIGGDQCGTEGTDYADVGSSPQIDVLDFHDYGGGPTDYGPAGSDLPTRIRQAHSLGKPIMVNEIGIKAGSCLPIAARADRFRDKLSEQRSAGTAGGLLWAFVPDPRPDQCTYDIGPDDPVWTVVDGAVH